MSFKSIAIEREYACGGTEIGEKLASRLDIPCYGKKILEIAAQRMNLDVEVLIELEERTTSSMIYSLYQVANLASGNAKMLTKEQELSIIESEIIKELVLEGPCVIVGRSATGILREYPDVLKVYIYSDKEMRAQRAKEIYGIDESRVNSTLKRIDRRRNEYYRITTGSDWRDFKEYHIMLDSAKLGIDAVVSILCNSYGERSGRDESNR